MKEFFVVCMLMASVFCVAGEPFLYEGDNLCKSWKPFGMERPISGADSMTIEIGSRGGFACDGLDLDAAEIAAIEVDFSAAVAGGYLRLDFSSEFQENKRDSSLTTSALIDAQKHTLYFPVAENAAWHGKITRLCLTWCSTGYGIISLSRVKGLTIPNLIPNAEKIIPDKEVSLPLVKPRGIYRLFWQEGELPEAELSFCDRNYKQISKISVPAGEKEFSFTAPLQGMTSCLAIHKKPAGFPVLQLVKMPSLDHPVYWAGGGKWIWSQNGTGPRYTNVWFKKEIELAEIPGNAAFVASGDDVLELFVNGKRVGTSADWTISAKFNVAGCLKQGVNEILVRVYNQESSGGFIGELHLADVSGKKCCIPSDGSWKCHVGGDRRPDSFNDPVIVIGPPPVAPWAAQLDYRYMGEKGEIEIVKTDEEAFSARVIKAPLINADRLYFKVVADDGSCRRIRSAVSPATGEWKTGENITVKYKLPPAEKKSTVFLDAEFIDIANNSSVGTARTAIPQDPPPLSTSRVIGAGTRPYIEFNGKKLAPIYFIFTKSLLGEPCGRDFFMLNAVRAKSSLLRTKYEVAGFWTAPGKYDFSSLDSFMGILQLNAPEMPVLLNVNCAMPEWWLKKNQSEMTAYANKAPTHPRDRQSLASQKWLQDVREPLTALINHIKKQPYASKFVGMAIAEGWNSEWFWNYTDGNGCPARSGYSKADYESFRSFLRERYKTDAALAVAWSEKNLTFETALIPLPNEHERGSVLALLDAEKDRKIIDFFDFRSKVLADAIEALCKIIKDETKGKWLAGVYYGYLIPFSYFDDRLQTVGHMAIDQVARSKYVDFVTAPSYYHWRHLGMADFPMQPAEAFSLHNKLVVVEQDLRTYTEPVDEQAKDGRMSTVEQTVGAMNRAFGMMVARGMGQHWFELFERWYREDILLDVIREQVDVYDKLPPPAGTTPVQVTIVSDTSSTSYAKHESADGIHKSLIADLLRRINEAAFPFRHVLLSDLLEDSLIPAQKLYIMTNVLVLSDESRRKLMARVEKEKATVLWLYAPGVFFPGKGPSPGNIEQLLGVSFTMKLEKKALRLVFKDGMTVQSINSTGPWFIPTKGFDEILAKTSDGEAGMVAWTRNGSRHYFAAVPNLSPEVLMPLAERAGVHVYSRTLDPVHVGNDTVFLHAKTGGEKALMLPAGYLMKAIIGPISGTIHSGEKWNAVAGQTYGFLVIRE